MQQYFLQCYAPVQWYSLSCFRRGAIIYYIVYTRHHQLIIDWYQNNKINMYQCSKKLVKYKVCSCFDHFDFPVHSLFTSDVCWDSLGTSIFGNSGSVASNTRSRLSSRLSFCFLWLCCGRSLFDNTDFWIDSNTTRNFEIVLHSYN